MLLIDKLFFFALGIVCGLVAFFAGAQGRREGIERAGGKGYEPVEMPDEAPPVMIPSEPKPEEIAAARLLACDKDEERGSFCGGVECDLCPFLHDRHPVTHHAARAWLASHGIPVEEAAL